MQNERYDSCGLDLRAPTTRGSSPDSESSVRGRAGDRLRPRGHHTQVTRFVMGTLVLVALAATANADVVHLRNGRTLRDVVVQKDVKGLRVTLATGSLLLRPDEVLRVVHTRQPAPAPALASTELRALAARIRAAYSAGRPAVAAKLLASHKDAHSILDAPRHVSVSGVFVAGTLRVTFRLRSADGPVALAVPPGTLAVLAGEEGDVPLVLLRAPVVVLDTETPRTSVIVPVTWSRFWSRTEGGEQRVRFKTAASATLERLAAVLCSGGGAPAAAPAQLALWIANDDIERDALVVLGTQLTCSRRLVVPLHQRGAAALLRKADVPLRKLRFFRAAPLPELPKANKTS